MKSEWKVFESEDESAAMGIFSRQKHDIYREWVQGVQFIDSDILCGLQIINKAVITIFVG